MITFKATPAERELSLAIARRAVRIASAHTIDYSLITAQMDILATHLNGCPLKLQELLDANDSNFIHDVFGIRNHLNRETGKLEDFFDPRYSQPEH